MLIVTLIYKITHTSLQDFHFTLHEIGRVIKMYVYNRHVIQPIDTAKNYNVYTNICY